jgi:hypothetical protein
MRYILNDSGYIEAISFGCSIECKDKTCTEYTGSIPEGYETLAIWSETANINAYKIVEGNLTYDSTEDARLQALWESQLSINNGETATNNYSTEEQVIGTWIDVKPIYRIVVEFTLNSTVNVYKNVIIIPNIKQMINVYGCFTNVDAQFNMPRSYEGEEVTIYLDQKNQRIREKHNYTYANDLPAYITLEYTKTID